jgi:hypothetical protein
VARIDSEAAAARLPLGFTGPGPPGHWPQARVFVIAGLVCTVSELAVSNSDCLAAQLAISLRVTVQLEDIMAS